MKNLGIFDGSSFLGAGILNGGHLTLEDCSVSGNYALAHWDSPVSGGAGIYNAASATLMMRRCTVAYNYCDTAYQMWGADGGGILNKGSAIIENCTIAHNSAGPGGEDPNAWSDPNLPLYLPAGSGGGIASYGTTTLINSTVTRNAYGSGIPDGWGAGIAGGGVTLENSIVAGNLGSSNISSNPSLRGTNFLSGNPMLQTLGEYGGPNRTMPPSSMSPVIGAGVTQPSTPATDQRSLPRPSPIDTKIDLGAVEFTISVDGPLIHSFTADQLHVRPGDPIGLHWTVSGADAFHIDPMEIDLPEGVPRRQCRSPTVPRISSTPAMCSSRREQSGSTTTGGLSRTSQINWDWSWPNVISIGGWQEGPTEIGFGAARLGTTLVDNDQPSVYFHKEFTVRDRDSDATLTLRLKANDGAIVYLNGTEVVRQNMPAATGSSEFATPALAPAAASGEHVWHTYEIGNAGDLLEEGENAIWASVHNSTPESEDLTFNLELRYTPGLLIARRSAGWKYDDLGVDRGTAWRQIGYDDSAWQDGQGEIGFGDGEEKTLMERNGQPTIYFRKSFQAASGDLDRQLLLRLRRDDGAAVYINGVEVVRDNLPLGEIDFNTFAVDFIDLLNEQRYFTFPLGTAGDVLQEGLNTIAVSVHNHALISSDISFDAELYYAPRVSSPETITLTASNSAGSQTATVKIALEDIARMDADNDGLADAWEIDMLSDLSQGPRDDGDGDGFFNSSEFWSGSNPGEADSIPPSPTIREIRLSHDSLSFLLKIEPPSYNGARVSLLYSSDMAAGSWLNLGLFRSSGYFYDADEARRYGEHGFYQSLLLPDVTAP